ncbi:serine/threonine protein kinase [Enterobacillus tribolii]|uniref:Serine/threonine protein kinase n=1 Tax=Enterobacillus tribolii TaxID=1487935 RepID=A0A370QS87_9GAMM|nr:serine/threonine-protein kinase [Enterobacillus tribolii]MBW7983742.1 serine/threonine protein kinase [Enterobacillus tribolii]RDK92106.1 serine/threonine protein kinase [Enterobacillus tribolii]
MLTQRKQEVTESFGCDMHALPPGYRFAQVEIQRVIGEGGFSIVYQAFDHRRKHTVAVKEYFPTAIAARDGKGWVMPRNAFLQPTFDAGQCYFHQEAQILGSLSHPRIPRLLGYWRGNGTAYISTPLFNGQNLKKRYAENPAMVNETWLKTLLVPLLNTLGAVHRQGCLHRDISWDNVQILDDERPVLLDFGSACFDNGDCRSRTDIVLKPGFSPAELYCSKGGEAHGPWSDIYSVGALIYTLITGRLPPVSLTRCIEDNYRPLATQHVEGYSDGFLRAIDHALAVSVTNRPQDVAAFARQLGVYFADCVSG